MNEYAIDKSNFDENDLAEWNRLIAKGLVKNPAAGTPQQEGAPAVTPAAEAPVVEKAAPAEVKLPDFVTAAIAKSEEFIEKQNKREMEEIAKKYSILGEKPEELGEKLYNLKKSDEAMYNTCISMLDKQVDMIEKSGFFAEIGKSGHSGGSYNGLSGTEAKVDAKAQEIMKADPNMTYEAAIAKAWEDPVLAAEYDAEYFGN